MTSDTQLAPALTKGVENAPRRFHLLAKPSGSACNIDCQYCFFLSKEALYPGERQRMSEETLEEYIRQLLESHRAPNVTIAWQGGEPTLMGLPFFQRSIELVEKYRRPEQEVQYTFQTNGIALNDDWGAFLAENPQHKGGVHRYSIEQFGLDPDTEAERVAAYCRRFDVPREAVSR